jgi:hypothetical protein
VTIWVFAVGAALLTAALLDVLGSLLGDSGRGGWLTGRLGEVSWRRRSLWDAEDQSVDSVSGEALQH